MRAVFLLGGLTLLGAPLLLTIRAEEIVPTLFALVNGWGFALILGRTRRRITVLRNNRMGGARIGRGRPRGRASVAIKRPGSARSSTGALPPGSGGGHHHPGALQRSNLNVPHASSLESGMSTVGGGEGGGFAFPAESTPPASPAVASSSGDFGGQQKGAHAPSLGTEPSSSNSSSSSSGPLLSAPTTSIHVNESLPFMIPPHRPSANAQRRPNPGMRGRRASFAAAAEAHAEPRDAATEPPISGDSNNTEPTTTAAASTSPVAPAKVAAGAAESAPHGTPLGVGGAVVEGEVENDDGSEDDDYADDEFEDI